MRIYEYYKLFIRHPERNRVEVGQRPTEPSFGGSLWLGSQRLSTGFFAEFTPSMPEGLRMTSVKKVWAVAQTSLNYKSTLNKTAGFYFLGNLIKKSLDSLFDTLSFQLSHHL